MASLPGTQPSYRLGRGVDIHQDGQDQRRAAPRAFPAMPYAGLALDRATDRREDAAWVAACATDPSSRLHPLHGGRCLVTGDPPVPVVLEAATWAADGETLVLLGLDDGVAEFAVDLSGRAEAEAMERTGADATADVRTLYASLSAAESGLLVFARGLLDFNARQRHCGVCGAPTEPRHAGSLRVCTRCGQQIFPRIEPAVIVLVETDSGPRRCLMAHHRRSRIGRFSLLAGFVEIGESFEDAVRRELQEEVGVAVDDVRYLGSQPWPFPSGVMIGFRASATEQVPTPDGDEVVEARWFTPDELRAYRAEAGRLDRADSIGHLMLTAWLAEG